jgi:hypothetical protein
MSDGVQLVLWIAGVHLIGFVCVAVLMLPALREDPDQSSGWDEGEDGWGRGPQTPPPPPAPPRGGVPLPDAVPAGVRFREPARLGDLLPPRERRPAREPERRPVRARD